MCQPVTEYSVSTVAASQTASGTVRVLVDGGAVKPYDLPYGS